MEILTFTGVTQRRDMRAEKPIHSVILQKEDSLDNFDEERVTIRKIGTNGMITNIVVSGLVKDLFEINAQGEGFELRTPATESTPGIHLGKIEIQGMGALYLATDEYIDISLTNLKDTATYSVYGEENPLFLPNATIYDFSSIPQGTTTKTFNVSEAEAAAIEIDGTTEIQVTYKNGVSCTFTPFELKAMMIDSNDIVEAAYVDGYSNTQLTTVGYGDLYVLNLIDANILQVTTDQSKVVNVYIIDSRVTNQNQA